jgi:hypothetical protein
VRFLVNDVRAAWDAIFDRDWVDEAPGPAYEPPAQIAVDWKRSWGVGGRCRDGNGLLMSRLEERERERK